METCDDSGARRQAELEEVLAAAAGMGRAHRRFRETREEFEQGVDKLKRRWMSEHRWLTDVWVSTVRTSDDGSTEWSASEVEGEEHLAIDPDDVERALGDYLLSGTVTEPRLADRVLMRSTHEIRELDWAASRAPYVEEIVKAQRPVVEAEAALRPPHEEFVRQLRRWFERGRSPENGLSGWSTILKAWRSAVSLTTRQAAELLDVSPSAVVRYEQGSRSPSAPYVAAMVDRLAASEPVAADTPVLTAARTVVRLAGGDTDRATELADSWEGPRIALQQEIEDNLADLTHDQLVLIAALIRFPDAADALSTWLQRDALRPITEALHAGGRQ